MGFFDSLGFNDNNFDGVVDVDDAIIESEYLDEISNYGYIEGADYSNDPDIYGDDVESDLYDEDLGDEYVDDEYIDDGDCEVGNNENLVASGNEETSVKTVNEDTKAAVEQSDTKSGIEKYRNWNRWDFFKALYDRFPDIQADYAGDERLSIDSFIYEMCINSANRAAIRYWTWLMDTFTFEKFREIGETQQLNSIGIDVLNRMLYYDRIDSSVQYFLEVLEEEYYFNYIFRDCEWEPHEGMMVGAFMANAFNAGNKALGCKIYEAVLKYRGFTNHDKSELWKSAFEGIDEEVLVSDYIELFKNECAKIGRLGISIIRMVEEIEESYLEEDFDDDDF